MKIINSSSFVSSKFLITQQKVKKNQKIEEKSKHDFSIFIIWSKKGK